MATKSKNYLEIINDESKWNALEMIKGIIDFNEFCEHPLPLEFIQRFSNELSTKKLLNKNSHHVDYFEDKLNSDVIKNINYYKISPKFIYKYFSKLDKEKILIYSKLDSNTIEKYKDELNWDLLSRNVNLPSSFYSKYADVVVLARECNMDQVRKIFESIEKEQIKGPKGELIKIEMFCHGALCMAVSGKCYLSLHEMNQSANRGACMQVCRRAYYVKDYESDIDLKVDNKYIMSPKDLKTIHFLNKMVDSGVRVFKIEGRARGPEYVKTVVECYDEALRAICDGTYCEEMVTAWDERLSRVFNRGFWNGYYLGQRLGEWSSKYGSMATRKKVYVGKCTNYFKKLGVAEILVESQSISVGDEYLITGETTGALEGVIAEMRIDDKCVNSVSKGTFFSMKCDLLRRGDRLYKMEIIQ